MRRLKLKVCGMTEPTNIAEIAALGPDYLGFIFYENSKRYFVDGLMLSYLSLDPNLIRVGVFVNADIDAIRHQVETSVLGAVQLSGNENSEYCARLKETLGQIQIFKSIDPSDSEQLAGCAEYERFIDAFIFDNKASSFGGSGLCFEWSSLDRYEQPLPYFISGGIGPHHIAALKNIARQDDRLIGIDINSRVEHAPGIKDRAAVTRIIEELGA
jgi:phosphoribosylanthranilate isomerase